MANDAEPYISAVADACQAAGLHVIDFWTDDIDPRDGGITISVLPEGDPDGEDWKASRTLGWNEQDGWFYGEPRCEHGELHNLLWLGLGALPGPAEVAEAARKLIVAGIPAGDRRRMMDRTRYRETGDEDGFDAELAAYAPHSCDVTAELGGTTYTCREHTETNGGSVTHHFAARWPACPAPWCRLEPGHRELHDIPGGIPEVITPFAKGKSRG